jgi:hypothetical protein
MCAGAQADRGSVFIGPTDQISSAIILWAFAGFETGSIRSIRVETRSDQSTAAPPVSQTPEPIKVNQAGAPAKSPSGGRT